MVMKVVRETSYKVEDLWALPIYRFFAMYSDLVRLDADADRRMYDAILTSVSVLMGGEGEYRDSLVEAAGVVYDSYEEEGDQHRTREERRARRELKGLREFIK